MSLVQRLEMFRQLTCGLVLGEPVSSPRLCVVRAFHVDASMTVASLSSVRIRSTSEAGLG